MASFTSSQSGLWSSASTWGGSGVPSDGDIVTIASGHTVTFDVDQSSFASGLAGLTINGTLKFKEDVITCLKMASNVSITVNGSLICGDENSPIQRPPIGSSTRAKIILQGTNTSTKIIGAANSTIKFVGWTPIRNRTKLAENANSGSNQIVLEDSLDLQAGDEIVIGAGSVNGFLTESRYGIYTVSNVSSDGKTITLSQNLGHSRYIGDYVAWYSRPIDIQREATEHTISSAGSYLIICGVKINKSIVWTGIPFYKLSDPLIQYSTITGGYLVGNAPSSDYYSISDCTFYNVSLTWGSEVIIKNSVFIQRNDSNFGFITYPNNLQIKNTWFQNTVAIYKRYADFGHGIFYIDNCEYKCISEAPFSHSCEFIAKNMTFTSTPQNKLYYNSKYYNCIILSMNIDYIGSFRNKTVESFNHNQIQGAYRAWMRGGTIQSVTNIYPPCSNKSYQYTLTSNTVPVHRTLQLGILQPQQEIQISCWLYKTIGNMSIQPRFQLIDNNNDPLIDPSAQPLQEVISSTSISNQWEELTIRYKNTTNREIPISVRCLAANSTGFIYEYINLDRIFYMSNVFG